MQICNSLKRKMIFFNHQAHLLTFRFYFYFKYNIDVSSSMRRNKLTVKTKDRRNLDDTENLTRKFG